MHLNNSTDSLDSLDFKDSKSDLEEETGLCNTVLITGPPGVGKTAAVYACAQELGFKVCEASALSLVTSETKAFAIEGVLSFCNAIADIRSQCLLPAQWQTDTVPAERGYPVSSSGQKGR